VIPQEDHMRYGGTDAVKLVLWFAMRASLSDPAQRAYNFQTSPPDHRPRRAGMPAGLMRSGGETWDDLLLRLDAAVMQSVVENRIINELHL
jgi:hypothetical protein